MSALRKLAGDPVPEAGRLLQVKNVTYRIGEQTILRDVSLTLDGGEIVGVIGPNGAGKSTLLKIIARQGTPTFGGTPASGSITVCGQALTHYRPHQLARLMGQVTQYHTLDAAFTVRDVVLMGRNPYLGRFEIEKPLDQAIAERAMQITSTAALADRLITTLSGGERQRVFLARALAQEPSILLLDEPTSNLDIRHQIEILALVQRLTRERRLGIVMAIHDLSLAARYCDRLVLLNGGAVLADGSPDDVLTPGNLERAFGVEAQPYRDPFTHDLKLSILSTHHA
ncbi:MAG TPA: ABC transporter ATP-binding protein [Aggregatilineaceae bacterium]|nr:ABC transporter ATP-binding protein [Aggregatilineaceae bacterium]